MSGTELQPAYVLHTRRFRESSLVIELLGSRAGRCAVLAKGALGARSSLQYLLQPFTPLLFASQGRGELPLLTRCEAAGPGLRLKNRALYCGLYVNELILRLCERDDPHAGLFPVYLECIQALAHAPPDNAHLEPVLRHFELVLLESLGWGMQLERALDGTPVRPDRRYHYQADAGPVEALNPDEGYSGRTLLALAKRQLDASGTRIEARALMRQVLDGYLGGRPLKSRDLFR